MVTPIKQLNNRVVKNKEISKFIETVLKARGSDSIYNMNDFSVQKDLIPTGIAELDYNVLGGGLTKGRIYEISGPESAGKTTLCLQIAAQIQRLIPDKDIGYIDSEHALDREYTHALGVDLNRLWVAQPDCGEQAMDIEEDLIKSGFFSLIITDSVAALTPRAIIEGATGDRHIGNLSSLVTQSLNKLVGLISQKEVISIYTNQMRAVIGQQWGPKETTTGGFALKHLASVRLEVRPVGKIKSSDGQAIIGAKVRIKSIKNKLFPPFRSVEVPIFYGEGFNREWSLINLAIEKGVILKSGAWYTYGDEKYQGFDDIVKMAKQDKDKCQKILDRVFEIDNEKEEIGGIAEGVKR